MITKDLKISKLLDDYPGSLDILLKISPHFQKLQNKMLRKALAGRVTIEQAASIARVDLTQLLSELNSLTESNNNNRIPAGQPEILQEKEADVKKKPEYLKSLAPGKIKSFDVRPILDSGKDPLKDIMQFIKELKSDEALLIINSFEPIPLYSMLGDKGFMHWTESEANSYNVYFYREKEGPVSVLTDQPRNSGDIDIYDFENIIDLDVHDLPAPEPMIKILENLTRIEVNTVMRVFHHREPVLLYPKLEERGYMAACTKLGDENYQILIAKRQAG